MREEEEQSEINYCLSGRWRETQGKPATHILTLSLSALRVTRTLLYVVVDMQQQQVQRPQKRGQQQQLPSLSHHPHLATREKSSRPNYIFHARRESLPLACVSVHTLYVLYISGLTSSFVIQRKGAGDSGAGGGRRTTIDTQTTTLTRGLSSLRVG